MPEEFYYQLGWQEFLDGLSVGVFVGVIDGVFVGVCVAVIDGVGV